jgi:hypothetical protein
VLQHLQRTAIMEDNQHHSAAAACGATAQMFLGAPNTASNETNVLTRPLVFFNRPCVAQVVRFWLQNLAKVVGLHQQAAGMVLPRLLPVCLQVRC